MSAAPASHDDPRWFESVLSTRSLSYISTADALDSPRASLGRSTFTARHPDPDLMKELFPTPAMREAREHQEKLVLQRALEAPSPEPDLPMSVSGSPLFLLPRELREAIYRELLTSPLGFNFPTDKLERSISPAILRTAKIVYNEAAPLLYTGNKLIFSHPSDANMFRHALASPGHAASLQRLILRVKNVDARLWTAYFNSTSMERSLVKDFPSLRILFLRFRGVRFQPLLTHEQNVLHWLRDPKLGEVIASVRRCVGDVRVELCVKVPEDWQKDAWDIVTRRKGADEVPSAVLPRVDGLFTRIHDVWIKLETEGT